MFKVIYLVIVKYLIICNGRCYRPERADYISQDTYENKGDPNFVASENGSEWDPSDLVDEEKPSTINVSSSKYQNGRNSEESDEYKSTLVNYPYSVSIQRKGAHYATGALVDKKWILSSAGEFYNVRESIKLFKARLGSVDCKKDGTLIPLKGVDIHPLYVYKKPSFDLALLRMATPVVYTDFIKPIRLSSAKGSVLTMKFMTTYWPRIIVNGQVLPESAKERVKYNSMRVSTQKLIPLAKCAETLESLHEVLHKSNVCLKPIVTHHSICMPDAGAPVLAEDGLWGITSGWISPKCPAQPGPTLFTRLSSLATRAWLNSHLYND